MFIEFPEMTGVIVQGLEQMKLPRMMKIRQIFDDSRISDVEERLLEEMEQNIKDKELLDQKHICIAVGSRGIPHLALIVRAVCRQLKQWGALPFIIPAMGSHGGATAEGQAEILRGYGITEETMGVPVLSSMEVEQYGELSNHTPLYCDTNAYHSDGIVFINKEKPHTAFRGKNESGLAKMIAIGIAKHKGAAAFHRQGMPAFANRVPEAAECFLKRFFVVCGIGIVENAYDEICEIRVVDAEHFLETDAENLKLARKRMAKLKFNSVDVLVIDEIGKNISGHGHDPNITGRAAVNDDSFRNILDLKRMVILGVTKESHHNGNGIADADITTRRCVNEIDWAAVWTNALTANAVNNCKIPIFANCDRDAVRLAAHTCMALDPERIKIARIRNTLELECIEVSEGLYEDLKDDPEIQLVEGPYEWEFDEDGNFIQ